MSDPSSPGTPGKGKGKRLPGGRGKKSGGDGNKQRRPLRIPKVKAGEGARELTEEDRAFIAEEIYQREQQGWSQEEAARRAGVRRSTLQHIERYRRGLGLHVAAVISRAFGCTIDFFVSEGRKKIFSLFWGGFYLELPICL